MDKWYRFSYNYRPEAVGTTVASKQDGRLYSILDRSNPLYSESQLRAIPNVCFAVESPGHHIDLGREMLRD